MALEQSLLMGPRCGMAAKRRALWRALSYAENNSASDRQCVSLYLEKLADTGFRKDKHFIHFLSRKWLSLSGSLQFDELAFARTDNIHIDVGVGIFGIGEVEDR